MRIGRNDPCPCGSGKKFKKCCLGKPSEGLRIAAKPGDSFLVDDVVDFDDADGPIQVYDPLVEPDPVEWLATGEQRRMDIVKHYHRAARSNAERSNAHAVVHTVVENQIAAGDELPVRRTPSRLMDEGLDRRQAIHAIGSVLAGHLNELMREVKAGRNPEDDVNDPYFAELERLTAEDWLSSG
jgi:hypothetical protein